MTQYVAPILTSLLDTDAYKLHMQQAVFHHYATTTVVAEFHCRNHEKLGKYADAIRMQIEHMHALALTDEEFNYLSSLPFFRSDYLQWLRNYRFDPKQVKISNHNGKLHIQIIGLWLDVILWEVPLLAVISELVHHDRSPNVTTEMAISHLQSQLAQFANQAQQLDITHFKLVDFGTRRRFSRKIHLAIVDTLKNEFPYFAGTSNYDIARRLKLSPVGTQAHEWFQAHQQISPNLAGSQRAALQAWLNEYPDHLGIALTDCITMDAFLHDFGIHFATHYQGLRHDSGDPILWGEKAIAHYQQLGINPLDKVLVFSDNLDLKKALALYKHFYNKTNLIFGIGTQLTCNIPNITPLNIVIKLASCQGKPVAKLSDSPGKTICQDRKFIKALRKAFGLSLVKKAS